MGAPQRGRFKFTTNTMNGLLSSSRSFPVILRRNDEGPLPTPQTFRIPTITRMQLGARTFPEQSSWGEHARGFTASWNDCEILQSQAPSG